jgi:hypothetical protein
LAPPPSAPPSCQIARPSTHNKTEKKRQLADERRESLVLYKSFHTLGLKQSTRKKVVDNETGGKYLTFGKLVKLV